MAPLPVKLCATYEEVLAAGPGAIAFDVDRHGNPDSLLLAHLPRVGVIALALRPAERRLHWEWNGSRERPTLSPVIRAGSGPGSWHGTLSDGQFIEGIRHG